MIVPRAFLRSVLAFCLGSLNFLAASSTLWAQTSPIGAWDFILTGNQRGVVKLAFFEDGALDGIGVLTLTSVTPDGTGISNLFGGVLIRGEWLFERTNRISGFMNLITEGSTNLTTNGISFHGTARPNRLNLMGFGFPGRVNFRGIPLSETNVVDLGGDISFLGRVKAKTIPFPRLEIFHLTTIQPNFYAVVGGGPGYDFTGNLLISNQGVAAISQFRGNESVVPAVATYVGPFNLKTRRGMLKGVDDQNPVIRYRITPEAP
jgi:hypothetical protein